MSFEVKIGWTANQWRQFFGRADITPIVELYSMTIDRVVLAAIHQRLAGLDKESDAEEKTTTSDRHDRLIDVARSGHDRRAGHG